MATMQAAGHRLRLDGSMSYPYSLAESVLLAV